MKLHRLVLGATLALGLVAGAAAQTVMKINISTAQNSHQGVAIDTFAKEVAKRTGGRYKIETFYNGSLGGERESIEAVQLGTQALTFSSTGPVPNFVPDAQILDIPFLFRDKAHARAVLDGPIGQQILDAFSGHDLVGLAFYDGGSRSFYNSEKPIHSIADMKGMKFRVMQSDIFVDMVDALGANATPMPYGEVYTSIQTGAIDGAENNWPSYDTSGHYEVAKYYTLDQHLIVPEVLVMSKLTWDKLTPEDQAIVRQAAKDSVPIMRDLWEQQEKVSQDKIRAAGVEVVTDIDKTPFIEAMAPVYQKYVTTDKLKDLVQRIQATE